VVRLALRHLTAILVTLVIAGWAIFYLPSTPSFAVFKLKQAIDARDGDAAANYVDFLKVVQNAGYEMVQDQNPPGGGAPNMLGQLFGKGAVDLLSGPLAALTRSWAVQQVADGARDVQMPAAAVAGAVLMLHRNDDKAYTQWHDPKGQLWGVRMEREDGAWRVVQVDNAKQLLEKLQQHNGNNLGVSP